MHLPQGLWEKGEQVHLFQGTKKTKTIFLGNKETKATLGIGNVKKLLLNWETIQCSSGIKKSVSMGGSH